MGVKMGKKSREKRERREGKERGNPERVAAYAAQLVPNPSVRPSGWRFFFCN